MSLEETIEKLVDAKIAKASQGPQTVLAEYQGLDSQGKGWVVISGSTEATPISRAVVEANPGDTVSVTIGDGRAVMDANISNPSAGVVGVKKVAQTAEQAKGDAEKAIAYSTQASIAANSAQASADGAALAAADAQTTADAVHGIATKAQSDADAAAEAASAAQTSADAAATAASVADGKAVEAGRAAAAAQTSASQANVYSTAALGQLGVVQDVVGVLDWASSHGTFALTSDTEIVDGKVYFTYDSSTGDYTPVIDPQVSALSTYYELSMTEAMDSFILAHLAVTSRGLWVLPSGMGSSTTPATGETQQDSDARQGSGYKMLLSSGGSYIYDSNGTLVRSDTASGTDFASGNDWHMGGQNAYIFYDASEGTINIGGSSVTLGGTKTLAELMSEVDNTLILKISESYNAARSAVTCTAIVLQGGEDIASTFPSSCFAWYLKSEGGTYPLEPLGTGYTMTVSLSDAGYGAAVKCTFTPPNDAALLDSDDDSLTDSDDAPLSVRSPSGDYVRVADLTTETDVFDTDKVMIVGSEGEHLATIGTLKGIFGDNDYESLDNRPTIEDVTLTGNRDLTDFGIFQTDSQGYSIPDDYTLTTTEINALWANAVTIG